MLCICGSQHPMQWCYLPTAIFDAVQTFAMKFNAQIYTNGMQLVSYRTYMNSIAQVHNFPLPRGYENQLLHSISLFHCHSVFFYLIVQFSRMCVLKFEYFFQNKNIFVQYTLELLKTQTKMKTNQFTKLQIKIH